MKKMLIIVVMSVGTMTAFAQEGEAIAAAALEIVETQDGFTEITVDELPAAIVEALAKDHSGATISKAYINEASQYKLEVTKEDGSAVELYADAEGNWIDL